MANTGVDEALMKSFVEEVMKLERRYAHEKRNVVTERRSKMREVIERFATADSDE